LSTNDTHTVLRTGDVALPYTNLGGGQLVSGNTYYVVNATTNTFGLALTPGGIALSFSTTGLRAGASHSFAPTVDLTSAPGGTDHQLHIDLTSSSVSGAQHITGPGGIPLGSTPQ